MLARTKALLARSQSRIGFWSKLAATPYYKNERKSPPEVGEGLQRERVDYFGDGDKSSVRCKSLA